MCGDITHVSAPYNKTACTNVTWNIPDVQESYSSLLNNNINHLHFYHFHKIVGTTTAQSSSTADMIIPRYLKEENRERGSPIS